MNPNTTFLALALSAATLATGTVLAQNADGGTATTPAVSADASQPLPVEARVNAQTYAAFVQAHPTLVKELAAAVEAAGRQAILRPIVLADQANAFHVIAMVRVQNPALAPAVFTDIIAILSASGDIALVRRLTELNSDLLETAAGDDALAPADLGSPFEGVTAGAGLENPNQLSPNRP